MTYDDGDVFRVEGIPAMLVRGDMEPEYWRRMPTDWKAELLRASFVPGLAPDSVIQCDFLGRISICDWCREPIMPKDLRAPIETLTLHYECGVRMAAGSVGHQQGLCECHGIVDRSEDGLSKRRAAMAALAHFAIALRF